MPISTTPAHVRVLPNDVDPALEARTRLVLLGTSGGPPWWRGSTRHGISSALAVGDAVYLVDCGEGWGPQYRRAGLGGDGYQRGLERLRAVFLTHQHSDHTVDYPNLLTLAWHNGGDLLEQPIRVYGPGDRGALPPVYGNHVEEPAVVTPERPTPGTVDLTRSLVAAYATDLNDRIRDYRKRDLGEMFDVHDIALPPGAGDDPNGSPSPAMEPFLVHEDDLVRVTAILVDHAPVFPAFAFRFDTEDGSVVFSGDTCPCDNLVALAAGADVLVHEVIDESWARAVFPDPSPEDEALLHHLLSAHTTIEQVGQVAQSAGVQALVLSHLVPGNNDDAAWQKAQVGYDGQLVVGQDLMQIGLLPATTPKGDHDARIR
jgi:ribonuclease BN (tRNA processing enzyme)